MCKLRHKMCNGQNISTGSPHLRNLIFLSNFTDTKNYLSTNLRPYHQNSFFSSIFSSTLSSNIFNNMRKLRHKLRNTNNRVAIRYTWHNEPLSKLATDTLELL